MPFVVACPCCKRKLQVPAACEGLCVRCPACAATFPAPVVLPKEAAFVPQRSETRAETDTPNPPQKPIQEGIVAEADAVVWNDRAAWHRVHNGLGWVAAGLLVGLGVLLVQSLPLLVRLSGAEVAAINEDLIWN